jgi:beta-glucosidase
MQSKFFVHGALALFAVAAISGAVLGQTPVYRDRHASVEDRVSDLFSRLTQDEKLSLLSGTGYSTNGIPRLGVPPLGMADAGQGVNGGPDGTRGPATLFPSGIVQAQTWDPAAVSKVGRAIGEEAQTKGPGVQVLLAPDVNIHRGPLGGRDGESFSEDPFLNSRIGVAFVTGVQSSGTSACVKHYICNNEEGDRGSVNVIVGERALHEIYMPAFKAAVEQGHSWSIMASYNRINGFYATANRPLLTDDLNDTWDFDGVSMSDWGAVHETGGVVNAGLDLEMPGGNYLTTDNLKAALRSGAISQSEIDDSDKRILRLMVRTGLLDSARKHTPEQMVNSAQHRALTRAVADEGIVLLKNRENILPIDKARIKSIAVIGPAGDDMQFGADGSPYVQPISPIEPLDAIKSAVGDAVAVNFAKGVGLPDAGPSAIPVADLTPAGAQAGDQGFTGEYFATPDLSGAAGATHIVSAIQLGRFGSPPPLPDAAPVRSARWSATLTAPETGKYEFSFSTSSGCRIIVDSNAIVDDPNANSGNQHAGSVELTAGKQYSLEVELLDMQQPLRGRFGWIAPAEDGVSAAVGAASKSDVALVFVTTHGTDGEGRDRPSMALPGDQNKLIEAVAAANKNTIVIVNSGTPVLMADWIGSVKGVLDVGFPGEEAGLAVADILFGAVDPSGKLSDTIGARREDYPDYGNFPGVNDVEHYVEGVYVGYRHFDKAKIAPLFPFGYGLSYTTFAYSNLKLSHSSLAPGGKLTATTTVTNTGKREGSEIAELYVHQIVPSIDRPINELKGFDRIDLQPGQSKTVTFSVEPHDLAYWDTAGKQWKADPGAYEIEVGASSRDIRLTKQFRLTGSFTQAD